MIVGAQESQTDYAGKKKEVLKSDITFSYSEERWKK